MADATVKQRLAAILAADVAGYSRLMGDDEADTITTLQAHRVVFRDQIEAHGGRVVDMAGDSVLAVFDSTTGAVSASIAVQHALAERNQALAEHRRMQFRIGVNLGDIREADDGTVYGDGVNVAARLESLAEPGGVTISGTVFEQIDGKLDHAFADAGSHKVKNITKPVRAYALGEASGAVCAVTSSRRPVLAALLAVLVIAGGVAAWWFTGPDQDSTAAVAPPAPAEAVQEPEPLPAAAQVPAFTGPSIAVLAFDTIADEPGKEYFGVGLAENIITSLSRFKQLAVIARNSSFKYQGQAVDVREIGSDLGVDYVLEGSVQHAGSAIRVTAQLLDTDNAEHLWSQTYDRELTDIFEVQDEITADVVGNIANTRGVIAQREERAMSHRPNFEAYDLWLKSRDYERTGGAEQHALARDRLEQAIEIDPDFATAYSNLGTIYMHEHLFGYNQKPNSFARAYDAIQKGLRLDPDDASLHMALASYHFFSGDLENYRLERDIALDLNPNDALALAYLGAMEMTSGNREKAAHMIYKAISLNPHHDDWYYQPLFWYHFARGEYEQCLELAEKGTVRSNWGSFTHIRFAVCHAALGNQAEAEQHVADLLAAYPDYPLNARADLAKWNNSPEMIELTMKWLTKAGMDIPPPPALTH